MCTRKMKSNVEYKHKDINENLIYPLMSYITREGSVLFNDALNAFYLRLYGVEHMVKDHSE